MTTLLIFGALLGLDNLLAASGLGLLSLGRKQRLRFAVGFVLFEAALPVVGFLAGDSLRHFSADGAETVGMLALLACGLLICVGSLQRRTSQVGLDTPWAPLVVPLLLSLDNLAAGAALGAMGPEGLSGPLLSDQTWRTALSLGLIAASLCVVGLAFGGALQSRFPRRAHFLGGACLSGVATLSLSGVIG